MTQPKIALTAEDKTAAAFAAVSRRLDGLESGFKGVRTAVGAAVASLAGIAVAGAGILALTNQARDAIDGIKDLAESSGSTVENISALDRIARETGGSFETVSGALVKFNQVLKDADPDKGAGAVLKALNLDIEELKRLDPAEALRLTAVALQGFADDGDKARAVQELFGKSVKETGPFLKDLAEAGKLHATVTTEQAEEVDKFNKQLAALRSNAEDASRSLTIDLVTGINEVIDRFRVGQKEGKGFFEIAFNRYKENVRGFYEDIGALQKEVDRSSKAGGGRGFVNPANASTLPSLVVVEKDKKPPKPKATKDPYSEAQRYLEALQKQLEATEKLTETEQALRDLQLGRLGKVTEKQRESILNTAAEIDAAKEFEKIAEEFKKLEEERLDRERERKELIKGLVDAGATQQLEQQRDVMRQLTAAYEKGELGLVGSEEALRKYTEAAQAFLGTADEQIDKISELDKFTQRAAENIQDALGDTFADVMEGNFDNIGDAFTKMLNRMVAEALAADLSRRIFGSAGGGSGDGWLGSLVGLAAGALGTGATASIASSIPGNSMDSFLALNNNFANVPSFDVGTDFVPKDMLAMVHKGERIVPADQNKPGAGGGISFYLTQQFAPGTDRKTMTQGAADAQRYLQSGARNL